MDMPDIDIATAESDATDATTVSPTTCTSLYASWDQDQSESQFVSKSKHLKPQTVRHQVFSRPAQLSHHQSQRQQMLPTVVMVFKSGFCKVSNYPWKMYDRAPLRGLFHIEGSTSAAIRVALEEASCKVSEELSRSPGNRLNSKVTKIANLNSSVQDK
uniref:Retrotransposon protein, putative, Ty3-gypsy subclass n=1 Tax=Oryza sativa subsp. japonica TaxID=39947 RepID=Q2R0C7_ORYSJ|nr:retrotransposon protein, putative, Ty3-gypsy subclass [Oryza sativa Japonica Group]